MAKIAQGLSKVVAYKKEDEFGVIPAKTGAKYIRRVTANFNLTKETYQSDEIRPDRQVDDMRHGVRSVEGSVNGELSAGAYSDFFASALGRDFTAVVGGELGETTIAETTTGVYTISRATGGWITDGVRVGNVILLGGLDEVENVDKNLLIIQLTETTATVIVLNGSGLTPVVDPDATYRLNGRTTYAPSEDHTSDSYTFEEYNQDIKQSSVTVGNKVNTIGISLPATGLTTVDIAFMGQDQKQTGQVQYFSNVGAGANNGIFASVNGALIVNGVVEDVVTSANININRNLTSEAVVGSNVKPEIYEGRIAVEGDFSTLYKDRKFADYFDNEDEISLIFALTESSAPDSNFVTLVLPRIKIGTDTKDDGEKGIVSQNSFTALKGRGVDGFEATTLMIHDSGAGTF